MLVAGFGLIAAGAIIPSLPPSVFDQSQLMAIPPSLLGGGAVAIGVIIAAIGHSLLVQAPVGTVDQGLWQAIRTAKKT